MNIIYICNEYPPRPSGGIGIFTKKLAEGLTELHNRVYVIGVYHDIPRRICTVINGVTVISLPAKPGIKGLIQNQWLLFKEIKKISLKHRIDIIESPDFEAPVALLPRLANKRITRLHGSHTYFCNERNIKPSKVINILERLQLKKSDQIISVSQYTADQTKMLFGLVNNIDVIYNSIDVSESNQSIKSNYTLQKKIIYFGTLAEKKGIFPLAKAWKEFIKKNPDWKLEFVGKDAFEKGSSNKEIIRKILMEDFSSVSFIDHLDHAELISSLKNYDLAILPSFSEAFALAPLEAMATGLPVIVSNMSSGPELINHGVDGWLCDPRNPATIVNTIEEAIISKKNREVIAKNALNKISSKFNYDKFLVENIEAYQSLLKNR